MGRLTSARRTQPKVPSPKTSSSHLSFNFSKLKILKTFSVLPLYSQLRCHINAVKSSDPLVVKNILGTYAPAFNPNRSGFGRKLVVDRRVTCRWMYLTGGSNDAEEPSKVRPELWMGVARMTWSYGMRGMLCEGPDSVQRTLPEADDLVRPVIVVLRNNSALEYSTNFSKIL